MCHGDGSRVWKGAELLEGPQPAWPTATVAPTVGVARTGAMAATAKIGIEYYMRPICSGETRDDEPIPNRVERKRLSATHNPVLADRR